MSYNKYNIPDYQIKIFTVFSRRATEKIPNGITLSDPVNDTHRTLATPS